MSQQPRVVKVISAELVFCGGAWRFSGPKYTGCVQRLMMPKDLWDS